MKVSMTSALLLSPLVVGTVVVALNEDWPWLHGFYWSVVTCTTVGYGDLRLEKQSTRVFATVFVLGGFALVGAALGNIGADMDKDGNGVDRCEFVRAMLVQLGKVTQEDVLKILDRFDDLDIDGSGILTSEDLQMLNTRRRRELRRSRGKLSRRYQDFDSRLVCEQATSRSNQNTVSPVLPDRIFLQARGEGPPPSEELPSAPECAPPRLASSSKRDDPSVVQ
eukprot:UN2029